MDTENRMLRDFDGDESPGKKKAKKKAVETPPKGVICPACQSAEVRTYKTVPYSGGRRRYRYCATCGHYFKTLETVAEG